MFQKIIVPAVLILGLACLSACGTATFTPSTSSSTPTPAPETGTSETVGRISGTVTNSSDEALAGALISIEGVSKSATTSATGTYEITGLETGRGYTLYASKSNYKTSAAVGSLIGSTAEVDFVLYPVAAAGTTGWLVGMVRDKSSLAALGGVTITVEASAVSTLTSSEGENKGVFVLQNLTPGTYRIFASKSGYATTAEVIPIFAGNFTQLHLYLTQSGGGAGNSFSLTSSAFGSGEAIPLAYAAAGVGGQGTSIPLAWTNAPAGTQAYALSLIDISSSNFVHWLVKNISVAASSLSAGASPNSLQGGTELQNNASQTQYFGPAPPETVPHTYLMKLYAVNTANLNWTSYNDFVADAGANIIGTAALTGLYTAVTWNGTINALFNNNCSGCHNGNTAFAATYTNMKNKALAGSLKTKVIDGSMGNLSSTEKIQVQKWIDDGAPQ